MTTTFLPLELAGRGTVARLRCHGRELYRILYRWSRNLFVLVHALEKRLKASLKRTSTPQRPGGMTSRAHERRPKTPSPSGNEVNDGWWDELEGDRFSVTGVQPGRQRRSVVRVVDCHGGAAFEHRLQPSRDALRLLDLHQETPAVVPLSCDVPLR